MPMLHNTLPFSVMLVLQCGDEFGHNVVVPPPEIPALLPEASIDSIRVQRLRLRFSKSGDAVFVGHLDLMRCFERALRRADLPISQARINSLYIFFSSFFSSFTHKISMSGRFLQYFTTRRSQDESPFHSRPRLTSALALGLGATSSGELLELTMARRLPPTEVAERLQAALPPGITVAMLGEFPVTEGTEGSKKILKLGSVIAAAESLVILGPAFPVAIDSISLDQSFDDSESAADAPLPTAADWVAWVANLLQREELLHEKINSKSKARAQPKRLNQLIG